MNPTTPRPTLDSPDGPEAPPASEPDPDGTGIDVEVSDTQSHLAVDPEAVARLVRGTLAAEGVEAGSLSIAVVDDATIHEVNRRHLEHDWPTDVITFPLSDPDDPEVAGELVVSAEMAVSEAGKSGVPAWDELALYVVHGLLHLCGYDDRTDDDRRRMRRREDEVLRGLGLTNTFAAAFEGSEGPSGSGGGVREGARWTV